MLYKLPQILKVVVLYSFLLVSFGALLETANPSARGPVPAHAPVVAAVTPQYTPNLPQQLIIPRLGITLSIVPGTYDPATRTWTLTENDIQHAGMTALPNDLTGNTLLYGHNTDKVLAPTDQLIEGDAAQIITKDGRTFTYTFSSGRLVDPSDTSVLKQTVLAPQLTLLTCDGLWDEKRRLMVFDFVSVQ